MQKIVYFFFAIFFYLHAFAQQPDLVFHHLTEREGLSQNIVNCFLKDSRGILWVGTYNGLSRYDGIHFHNFRKGKTENTIHENTVHKLAEDKKGNIWGATENGIFCYNQKTNSFKPYKTPDKKEWNSVHNILCDQQGIIWATDVYALTKYNATLDSFEKIPIGKKAKTLDISFSVRKNGLVESPDGKSLWLATDIGLYCYDKIKNEFIYHRNSVDSLLFTDKSSSALSSTKYGHFWYYDNVNKRLIGFDPITKKYGTNYNHNYLNPETR